MIPPPPTSTLFPTRRSSDLLRLLRPRRQQGPDRAGHLRDRGRYAPDQQGRERRQAADRKSTRLNSSHVRISYAVFCLKKKKRNKLLRYLIFSMTTAQYMLRC